jgi:beta-N-acetylhexosaminidase
MVMVGHAGYPSLQGPDPGPATLSRAIVQELLRERIRYRGVILTDDLEMGAVDQTRPPGEVVLEALEAGNDMVMYCKAWDRIEAAHDGLTRAVRTGKLSPARLDASLSRILSLKEQLPRPEALPLFADSPFAQTMAELGSLESRLRA